ncbi:MAG TPA: SDR family NAD(P)-dependent oxidoreductase [Terriglobales bacterium]|jgi:NAD(P)-dependent dehydrogenase (short-subunit alcohol dehydrogenase family)|nr:SDR family NAD(P)-dependent oxidoreductase [Terriglobales bacterium]
MKDLSGKVVLVTGAGRGIGRAIALAFAAEKSRLVITGRTAAALDQVAAEIKGQGAELLAVTCDVTQKPEVDNLRCQIESHFGAVQILVNNVGIAPATPFLEMPDSLWDEVMRVNLSAAYHCCKTFLPPMVSARWGRIINIASTVARVAYPQIAAYATSKHAVLGLTRSLAMETARSGVTVNAVCPGYVDTELTRDNARRMAEKRGQSVDEALARLAASCPQRRLIEPDEVAYATLMLASDRARGITGQGIQVDGGAVMA